MPVSAAEPVCTKQCRLTFKKISAQLRLRKLVRYFSSLANPAILGGAVFNSERNRYSYFASEPVEIFDILADRSNPFKKLKTVLKKYSLDDIKGLENIFTGGWVGFFSYDLNRFLENVPVCGVDDVGLPLIRLCFYDKIICFDHLKNCFYLFAIELPEDEKSGGEKIAQLQEILSQAANSEDTMLLKPCDDFDIGRFSSNMTKDYYLDALAKIKRYIYDGEVYQINFSQRFSAEFCSDAFKLFLWQNEFNPSPYSAYIDGGDWQIVSASPELIYKYK